MLRESTGMNGAAIDHRSLWFLNTYVTIRISSRDGSDGISVHEHGASQGDSPPLHIHHDEDEIFHVLEGEVRYRVGDQEHRARAGATLLTPKGIPHTYRVESAEARMLTITLGEFETFIRAFGRLAERRGCLIHPVDPHPNKLRRLRVPAVNSG
jgi:quercetin dioxygenase-like cupin family protein